ncbi:putative nucleotidyltransferase [Candidatus Nitrotoga sp. BS]|uniref:nucleotidyltransferase domain-containing protein n=1 Tax=Candidatus Nitrotoga sp. BS TaxID=2890408 RepID=UPI001EF1FE83|nr:nucleotidyltransferase family protein [Candidatus Nitrotoga sp. BS]CAH1197984.1 putative nucleotidyltransferase [Candidatus Nitrotoga sp. BS]
MIPNYLILQALREPESLICLSLPDWDLLICQARRANLLARICILLDERGLLEQVPPKPREHLEWSRVIAERHVQAIHWEITLIRKALAKVGVPVILLKGAAYVMAKLPPAKGRLFSDIDILVPKDSLSAVEATLMLHGWAATHHDAYDQRYYRTWMHELPPMQHIKRMTVIDVHHAILPETAALHPDSAKLRATAQLLDGYDDLKVLAPADMVLHSAVHLFHNDQLDQGLRDLVDIDSLLRHFSRLPTFWPSLSVRAHELELTRPLFYALRYAVHLLNTPIPSGIMEAARSGCPNPLALMFTDQLFERALMPAHKSCSDWLTGAARQILYVRATWLRMPPLLLARHLFHKAFISPKPA